MGNPGAGLTSSTTIKSLDDVMHAERIDKQGHKIVYSSPLEKLPTGVCILHNGEPYLISNGTLLHWTPAGYGTTIQLPATATVEVLTPASVVNAIREGYSPQIGQVQ